MSPFGALLRFWRGRSGLSQEALAHAAHTTPRHLSFLETGRSRPGEELVRRLATAMALSLRAQNELFLAAGFAAEYREESLDAPAMRSLQFVLDRLLRSHEPYPAWVFRRGFLLVAANEAAERLFPGLLTRTPEEIVDQWFAPGPFRTFVENWAETAHAGLQSLRRDALRSDDPALYALLARAEKHVADAPLPLRSELDDLPVACPRFRVGEQTIRTISSVLRFDTATEITASELRVELMFPADERSAQFFRSLAG